MERPLLDPHLLQSFVAIVETGSFTRAGERMHLTQSTISQQMRRLEQQLGCPLLDRSGRQVVTTAQGETLLGLARRILGLLARAGERVSEASHPLRLGVPEDFAAGAMTAVLAAFARQYPEVRLEVQSGLSHVLWQAFEGGELDLALIKQGRGLGDPIARWREPLAWVDSRGWPACEREPVPLVVFPSEGVGHEVAATSIVKGAPHLKQAEALTDWIVSRKGQQAMVDAKTYFLPIREDVQAGKGVPALSQIKLVESDPTYAAQNRKRLVDRWLKDVLGQ